MQFTSLWMEIYSWSIKIGVVAGQTINARATKDEDTNAIITKDTNAETTKDEATNAGATKDEDTNEEDAKDTNAGVMLPSWITSSLLEGLMWTEVKTQ